MAFEYRKKNHSAHPGEMLREDFLRNMNERGPVGRGGERFTANHQ